MDTQDFLTLALAILGSICVLTIGYALFGARAGKSGRH